MWLPVASDLFKSEQHHESKQKLDVSALQTEVFFTRLTLDAKTAGVQCSSLGGCDVDFQIKFLQRPAVGLSHILTRGCDVSLRHKQSTQIHMNVLQKIKTKLKHQSNTSSNRT